MKTNTYPLPTAPPLKTDQLAEKREWTLQLLWVEYQQQARSSLSRLAKEAGRLPAPDPIAPARRRLSTTQASGLGSPTGTTGKTREVEFFVMTLGASNYLR